MRVARLFYTAIQFTGVAPHPHGVFTLAKEGEFGLVRADGRTPRVMNLSIGLWILYGDDGEPRHLENGSMFKSSYRKVTEEAIN